MKDRRQVEEELQALLKKLTLAQECSLSDVSHFGYELAFVRKTPEGSLAIVQVDNQFITIDDAGEVDYHPEIKIRP